MTKQIILFDEDDYFMWSTFDQDMEACGYETSYFNEIGSNEFGIVVHTDDYIEDIEVYGGKRKTTPYRI